MQEIEIEYKNLLTKTEFNDLLFGLAFPEKPAIQTNRYFETFNFTLKSLGCALRIREKNQTFTLTLKEPHPSGLLETHDTLTVTQAQYWPHITVEDSSVIAKLAQKGIKTDDLIYFGSMTTKRRELHDNEVIYTLDESNYHDITDYELEIEATSEKAGKRAMENLLTQFNIHKRSTPNKIQRFFAYSSDK